MKRFIGLSICAALAWGCGDDDGGPTDSGPPLDGVVFDVGTDDTGNGRDAGPDAPSMVDAGDADTGGGSCDPAVAGYGGCTPDRGCALPGQTCRAQFDSTLGDTMDPIQDHPDGDISVPLTFFTGGLCTPQDLGGPGVGCDPSDAADTTCGDCGVCSGAFGVDVNGSICLQGCEPSVTDNGVCRDGYTCDITGGGCLPVGCSSDAECRVERQNTNGIEGIQTPADCMANPADCGGMAGNFDRLVYDTDSTATCNMDTFECQGGPSSDTASGGDACTTDVECEDRGRCLTESEGVCTNSETTSCTMDSECTAAATGAAADGFCNIAWQGGSCIKLGCDVAGNECANDGVCQERGLGVAICLAGCTVGAGADPMDPATWIGETGRSGCREGYRCVWNGVGGHGVANNGVCVPDAPSGADANNIGASCTNDSECWNPFGNARCIIWGDDDANGVCAALDCNAPYFDAGEMVNICGDGAECVNLGTAADPNAICLAECDGAADCNSPSEGCVPRMALFGMGEGSICFPGCTGNEDCRDGETCEGATAMSLGSCM